MSATVILSQNVITDGFVDELNYDLPFDLQSSTEFPPLGASTDDWSYINAQDTNDIYVTEDIDEWEQLDLAIKQSLEPEYCFAAVAKQTTHVPAPEPKLIARTPVFDAPIKRRQKSNQQNDQDNEDYTDGPLEDIYPYCTAAMVRRESKKMKQRREKLNLGCHVCVSIIPPKKPKEPVITSPLLHSRYSYSTPLTFHQYQHALFKLIQIHQRTLSRRTVLKYNPGNPDNRKTKSAGRLLHEPISDLDSQRGNGQPCVIS
jgi:hypothetical protein